MSNLYNPENNDYKNIPLTPTILPPNAGERVLPRGLFVSSKEFVPPSHASQPSFKNLNLKKEILKVRKLYFFLEKF